MYSVVTTAEHEDGSVAYQVREQRDDRGQTVLTLTGEFDHDANAVVDGIVRRLWGGSVGEVVVDLRAVTFLNGHGLAAMLHLRHAARARDRRLVLRCQAGTVCRLLGLIGLGDDIHEVGSAPPTRAPALRLVQGEHRDPAGPAPRRRHRPGGAVSRRWHHGET